MSGGILDRVHFLPLDVFSASPSGIAQSNAVSTGNVWLSGSENVASPT